MSWISNRLVLPALGALLLTGSAFAQQGEAPTKPADPSPLKPRQIKPRFEVKDRDWPGKVGDASVCLWKDDALGALSITIDDNTVPDHPWWLEMGQKYGMKVTWFIITNRINEGVNPGFNGTWDTWKKIREAGHDVQSHTARHGHTDEKGWNGIENEYAESKKAIEENVPGDKCLTVAFFGGPNSNLNDPTIAAKYYIGGRGGSGSLNAADRVDYANTNSVGGIINIGDAKFPSQDLNTVLEKTSGSTAIFYRGWYCSHFHGMSKPDDRAALEKKLATIQGLVKENKVWVGTFREVVQYGQERDTAKVSVTSNAADKIVLNLTDTVDDDKFDMPLTVKVRIDPSWKTVEATQSGKAVEAKVIDHDGAAFALVQPVPDRGEVTIRKGA
jgi:peptidoglycan/xylan/chitin deacetylase (PgdA/CDA1 family)